MNNLAPNLQPQPTPTPDQWPGVFTVHGTNNYDVGIHKAGSAFATASVSLIASGVFAATGHESPILNVENERDPRVVEVFRDTTSTHDPSRFIWSSSKRVGTQPVLRQQHRFMDASVVLPGAASFEELASDPAAQRPLDPEGLTSFLLDVKHAQDEGWSVTSVTRVGMSSDEFRADGNSAGLGHPNPANERFAEQYGSFAGDLFEDEAAKAGVDLSEASVSATSHEAVLDAEELGIFDAEARRLGFANSSQFVAAYKANPEAMGAEAEKLMDAFISSKRGADFVMQLSRTVTEEEGVYATKEAYRCITKYRTDIKTETLPPVTDHIPVFPMPVPVPAWRRKRWPEDEAPQAEIETSIPRVLPPGVKDVHQMRRERMEADGAGVDIEVATTRKNVRGDLGVPGDVERTGTVKRIDWAERAARRDRAGKWVLGIAAGTLVALISTIRLEAVHCPETKDGGSEESSGSALYFEIPFTDLESERSLLVPPDCDKTSNDVESNGGGNQGNSEPTCDTHHVVYQDGVLIANEETHYPGAITIIEK